MRGPGVAKPGAAGDPRAADLIEVLELAAALGAEREALSPDAGIGTGAHGAAFGSITEASNWSAHAAGMVSLQSDPTPVPLDVPPLGCGTFHG